MIRFLCAAILTFLCASAQAQMPAQKSDAPVEITAQKSLDWDRDHQLYRATGGATAKQGDFSVTSDDMQAKYEGDQSNLKTLEADGSVVITSQGRVARGDHATYDIASGNAVLTGKNLSFATDKGTLTARDKFTMNSKTDDFQAFGAVKLTSATDVITGDHATYNAKTKQAVVTGTPVTLTRGPNVLTGERATVDMVTNISHLFGGTSQPARAVFYPHAKDEPKAGTP